MVPAADCDQLARFDQWTIAISYRLRWCIFAGANMFIRTWTLAAVLAVTLAGCQSTAQGPATASGKAEVTIRSQTSAVKARLISLALDRRFSVTKDTEYLLQVEKPSDNPAATFLLGSRYDAVPSERWVFTFAPIGDSVRVVAAGMYVTNPGSAFERITPINNIESANKTQSTLDELKITMEAAPLAPATASRKPGTSS
jgi:hypothetical protein